MFLGKQMGRQIILSCMVAFFIFNLLLISSLMQFWFVSIVPKYFWISLHTSVLSDLYLFRCYWSPQAAVILKSICENYN
jgi:hypothetical protein